VVNSSGGLLAKGHPMSSFGATASCPMASVSIAGRTRTRQLTTVVQLDELKIASMGMATDSNKLFDDRSSIELAGVDMTRRAATEQTMAHPAPSEVGQHIDLTMEAESAFRLPSVWIPRSLSSVTSSRTRRSRSPPWAWQRTRTSFSTTGARECRQA
jgi:hypothetical protein